MRQPFHLPALLLFPCVLTVSSGQKCDLAKISEAKEEEITACTEALRDKSAEPSLLRATGETEVVMRESRPAARQFWIEIHRAYHEAVTKAGSTNGLRELHAELVRKQEDAGAAEPFGAIVDLGVSLTTAGNDTIPMSKDATFDNKAKGVVRFESKRVTIPGKGRKPTPFQLSLGGQFGYSPSLLLLRLHDKSTGTLDNSDLSVLYQDSFVWDLQPRLGWTLGRRKASEISLYGRFGQSILSSDVVAFKRGSDDVTLDRVENRSGRAAGVVEAGPEFRFFSRAQADGGEDDPSTYLSPRFSAAIAYRHDSRFAGLRRVNGFSGAADRFLYRFTINLNKVVSNDPAKNQPFSVKFSVEREQPLHRGSVPQGTKIIVQSDIDVMKLLAGGSNQ